MIFKKISKLFAGKALFTIAFLVAFLAHASGQDSLLVRGVILSTTGKPLPNISVSIEGSNMLPVITDPSGSFSLKAGPGSNWIIFTSTGGFKRKRVYLGGRTELKVYLTPLKLASGDDPVSLISQEWSRKDIVASFDDLDMSDVAHSGALTIDQYMQGRAGVYTTNRSGDPGSGAYSTIRGIHSIFANNQPLYVVDGIPLTGNGVFSSQLDGYTYDPLSELNLFDISKAYIVKDPTMTSTYGSKGSNGIVFIETLDPSVTQTTIEVNLREGYSLAPTRLIPQLNASQHKALMNEILFTTGKFEEEIQGEYPGLFLEPDDEDFINYQHDTRWQELIYRNSAFTNFDLKVKGGDEIARYGLSFGYVNGQGIIKSTSYSGYSLRFVSKLNIFTWLKMNAGVSLNNHKANLKEAATVRQTSPILASLAKSPLLNPYQYDIDGNEVKILSEVNELGVSNPLAIIENYSAHNTSNSFIANLGFEASIKDNLSINSNFSLTYDLLKEELFLPNRGMEHYYNNEAYNVSKASNNSLTTFYNNTYLKYNIYPGKDQRLSSVTGMRLQVNDYEYDWGLTKNSHENDQYRYLQDGTDNLREIGGANRNWNWITFYEHATYAFRDKYMLTAGLSADGSSRVGDDATNTVSLAGFPFGLFYSGGAGWRISGEPFLSNATWLEELKLRITAGMTGNDNIGEATATNYYQAIKFRQTVGLYPAVLPNTRLSYETIGQLDAGLDFSVLGNRVRSSLDVYRSTSNNLLILTPVDAFLGEQYRSENGGTIRNQGVEMNAFVRIIDNPSFKWDIKTSLSILKNEVTSIKGGQMISEIQGGTIVNMEGQPANSFYGYHFKGVYATQEEADAAGLVNGRDVHFMAGDAIFEDISGPNGIPDSVINEFDRTIIGSALPDYFGGLSSRFTYKRWGLNVFLQFVSGNEVFNYLRYENEKMSDLSNQSTQVLDRWQYQGQQTDVPRALWDDPIGNAAFSSRWIEDGSYMRVKNITLSYTIPDEFLAFRYAEFYVSAYNIFVLSKYLGYDPEFSYSDSQIHQGVDYGLTPQARQFIAGIRIGL